MASPTMTGVSGGCYRRRIVVTAERAAGAKRMKGTAWDFTDHPERLLAPSSGP